MPGAGAGAGAAEKFYSEPEPEPEPECFPGAGAGADQKCHGSASLLQTQRKTSLLLPTVSYDQPHKPTHTSQRDGRSVPSSPPRPAGPPEMGADFQLRPAGPGLQRQMMAAPAVRAASAPPAHGETPGANALCHRAWRAG